MKTAFVTGASYGIGASIAEALLSAGWKVYGLSRTEPMLHNDRFVWLQCDLRRANEITGSLRLIKEPRLDALISNAGVIDIEKPSTVSQSSYNETFSVNVLAPMLIVNALRDKITHATIVSISSVADRIPEADLALYSSSKAANTMYFDALADEFKGARIYALLPDYVDTPMQRRTNGQNKDFDWGATLKPALIANLVLDLISGKYAPDSGSNIIVVNDKLKEDLKSVEKLYGFNTDVGKLTRLSKI